MENELGIGALTALATDALVLGKRIGEAAADGFQYTDAFALVSSFPQMKSIAENARPAFRELKDLTPDEALQLSAEVSRRAGLPDDQTTLGKIRASLHLCAATYEYTIDTFEKGKALVHQWGDLLNIQRLQGDGLEA